VRIPNASLEAAHRYAKTTKQLHRVAKIEKYFLIDPSPVDVRWMIGDLTRRATEEALTIGVQETGALAHARCRGAIVMTTTPSVFLPFADIVVVEEIKLGGPLPPQNEEDGPASPSSPRGPGSPAGPHRPNLTLLRDRLTKKGAA
jgi:hypothetical protein